MDNSILVWAGLGLFTILFIVALVFSYKTWKVVHILALLAVYGAAVAFLIYASVSLKTNFVWKKLVHDLREKREAVEKEKQELLYGKELLTFAGVDESQMVLPAKLWRTTYDQGLILRGCTPGNFDGTSIPINTVAEVKPAADGSIPPSGPNGLSPKMIVYAFQETYLDPSATEPGDPKVPAVYLGEWQVTAATDNSATLSVSLPLDAMQTALATRPGGTWVLYARLPRDSHYAFVDYDSPDPVTTAREALHNAEQELAQAELGSDKGKVTAAQNKVKSAQQALDEIRASARPLFGQPLTPEQIAELPGVPKKASFPNALPGIDKNEALAIYDKLLERLAYDGLPLKDIPNKDFDTTGHVYEKVKFKLADGAPYSVEVDAPTISPPFDTAEDQEVFDIEGRARSQFLSQGGPTQFTNEYDAKKRREKYGPWAVDDIGVFDETTAERLVNEGTAEKLDDQFYVRPLRDFEFQFNDFYRKDKQLDLQIADVQASTQRAADATILANAERDLLATQKMQLESDDKNFLNDLNVITAERTSLQAAQKQQVAELSQLFKTINLQLDELKRLHVQMMDEARRRAELASNSGE